MPFKTNITITRGGFKKATNILTIIFILFAYIVADYLRLDVGLDFVKSAEYWTITIINMVLIIAIMVVVRSLRKQNQINKDANILTNEQQIQRGFNKITVSGFSSELDKYLETLNKENKYQTFLRITRAKLIKYSTPPFWGMFKQLNKKYVEKRKTLNDLLVLPKEEITKMDFKYKPVTISKLFSSINGKTANDNEFDIDIYENADVGKMVGLKALCIILFASFTTTIASEFFMVGLSAIYSTCLKLLSLLFAINTAMNTADDFVNNNIKTSLQRKLTILSNFVKETPTLKDLLTNENKNN